MKHHFLMITACGSNQPIDQFFIFVIEINFKRIKSFEYLNCFKISISLSLLSLLSLSLSRGNKKIIQPNGFYFPIKTNDWSFNRTVEFSSLKNVLPQMLDFFFFFWNSHQFVNKFFQFVSPPTTTKYGKMKKKKKRIDCVLNQQFYVFESINDTIQNVWCETAKIKKK